MFKANIIFLHIFIFLSVACTVEAFFKVIIVYKLLRGRF